jgi:hypothetical protein
LFNHEYIVDWLRFDLPPLLRQFTQDRFYVVPETAQGRHRGILYPDMVLAFPDGHVVLEVGQCPVNKWPDYGLVHISFDGTVSLVNPAKGSRHMEHIGDLIESTLRELLLHPVQIALV